MKTAGGLLLVFFPNLANTVAEVGKAKPYGSGWEAQQAVRAELGEPCAAAAAAAGRAGPPLIRGRGRSSGGRRGARPGAPQPSTPFVESPPTRGPRVRLAANDPRAWRRLRRTSCARRVTRPPGGRERRSGSRGSQPAGRCWGRREPRPASHRRPGRSGSGLPPTVDGRRAKRQSAWKSWGNILFFFLNENHF